MIEMKPDLAKELEATYGDRAIDGLFVHVSGPKMMQIIRALRSPPARQNISDVLIEALEDARPFVHLVSLRAYREGEGDQFLEAEDALRGIDDALRQAKGAA